MKRRLWLGTALAAAAGGVGLSVWRNRPQGTPAPDTLWQLELERPQGDNLKLSLLQGSLLLVNFWATWCPPCIKEMPALDRFSREFNRHGGKVLGIAIDGAAPVRDFLQRQPVSYDIALAGLAGSDLMRQLGNQMGVLPFSVLIDAKGVIRQRKPGETSHEELLDWVRALG